MQLSGKCVTPTPVVPPTKVNSDLLSSDLEEPCHMADGEPRPEQAPRAGGQNASASSSNGRFTWHGLPGRLEAVAGLAGTTAGRRHRSSLSG